MLELLYLETVWLGIVNADSNSVLLSYGLSSSLCASALTINGLDKNKVTDKTNNNTPLLLTVESLTLIFDINVETSILLVACILNESRYIEPIKGSVGRV